VLHAERIRDNVLALGRQLGFVRARVARVVALEREAFLKSWLDEGRAGDMRYLQHHRKVRLDPRTRFPWARSIVSAAFPYTPPPPPRVDWRSELRGRIAAYALGDDYHDVVEQRLATWSSAIAEILPSVRTRAYVDTGPVLEHEWAAQAGVGWTGKHTLTLATDVGSYFFLAEMFLSVELEPDPPAVDRCGTCTRCVDACPTHAIEPGYRLDPRRCLSYLTIEHRGAIEKDLRPLLGEWIFGCDLCQTACPWNGDARGAVCEALAPSLAETVRLDQAGFVARYGRSAVRRTGRVGLARNAAVVLGNTGNPQALEPLAFALLQHDAPLVRSHAAFSVGRLAPLAGLAARRLLESARLDPDVTVRDEVSAALDAP
jgi:epoxyqueuosine reductase